MKVFIILLLVAAAYAVEDYNLDAEFENFKMEYEKKYDTPEEEAYRKGIFAATLKIVTEHNKKYEAGETSFELGINYYADWTREEFKAMHVPIIHPEQNQ